MLLRNVPLRLETESLRVPRLISNSPGEVNLHNSKVEHTSIPFCKTKYDMPIFRNPHTQ